MSHFNNSIVLQNDSDQSSFPEKCLFANSSLETLLKHNFPLTSWSPVNPGSKSQIIHRCTPQLVPFQLQEVHPCLWRGVDLICVKYVVRAVLNKFLCLFSKLLGQYENVSRLLIKPIPLLHACPVPPLSARYASQFAVRNVRSLK